MPAPKQDERLSQTLLRRFNEAKKAREKYDSTWERNHRLYMGDQWNGITKAAQWMSEPVYNKIFEFVETMRGFLSDRQWSLDVVPASAPEAVTTDMDRDDEFAPKYLLDKAVRVNKLLDFLWVDTRMSAKLASALMHTFEKGTGVIKCAFDPDDVGDTGIGQVEVGVVDPVYLYPDPDATCVEDASFLIEKHPVSVRWVIERYPESAAEFLEQAGASSMKAAPRGLNVGLSTHSPEEGRRIDVLECWFKDSAILEDALDETGNPIAKYPNGRYVLMTDTGYILEDHECAYDVWPYVLFREIPRPGEFWGDCTVDKVASLQLQINSILRSIIDNGVVMNHGFWIADQGSGVTPAQLSKLSPRGTVVKTPGSEVRRDLGQSLPPHFFQLLESLSTQMDRVIGLPDVLRGIVPSRQPVQTTLIQQESGEVRTRERSRRVEESLEALGRLWLAIVAEHWTDARTVRASKPAGGFEMFSLSKDDLAEWRFDIHVRPGSTTPLNIDSALQKALELKREGIAIPDSYIVKLSGLPGIESALDEETSRLATQQAPTPPIDMPPVDDGLMEPSFAPA